MSAVFWLCRIVIGSFSKKIARQVAVGVSHAATCRVALRTVEAASTFSATCNAIFRCETSCKHGMSHEGVFLATCNATPLHCKLQGKLPRVTWPLDFFLYKKQNNTWMLGNMKLFLVLNRISHSVALLTLVRYPGPATVEINFIFPHIRVLFSI